MRQQISIEESPWLSLCQNYRHACRSKRTRTDSFPSRKNTNIKKGVSQILMLANSNFASDLTWGPGKILLILTNDFWFFIRISDISISWNGKMGFSPAQGAQPENKTCYTEKWCRTCLRTSLAWDLIFPGHLSSSPGYNSNKTNNNSGSAYRFDNH